MAGVGPISCWISWNCPESKIGGSPHAIILLAQIMLAVGVSISMTPEKGSDSNELVGFCGHTSNHIPSGRNR